MFPGLRRFFWKFRVFNPGARLELRVAKVLRKLRKFGYRAFYNLRQDGDNIDHVIVGPAGVFAIATKRLIDCGEIESPSSENPSRALRLAEGLELAATAGDGGSCVRGSSEEEDCLKQARENLVQVNRIIQENCEFDGWVWPLVVFAGKWPVRSNETTSARLFTTDKLLNHIVNQEPRLTPNEIELIASHFERSAQS